MQPYVHIFGHNEIDSRKARVILSFEHSGNSSYVWVESDAHEPVGYPVGRLYTPELKVIICGNEICILSDCLRKAYYEQLHAPSLTEVVERDMLADQTDTLAEMIRENTTLAEESEERRQEIDHLTGVFKNQNDTIYRYRVAMQTNIAELSAANKELGTCKQEIERLNGQVDRYRLWIQTTIQVLEESDPETSDHALAAELRRRMAGLDQRLGQQSSVTPESGKGDR